MLLQKISGVTLIALGFALNSLVSKASSLADADGTGAFIVVVVGAVLLFAKRRVLMTDEDYH